MTLRKEMMKKNPLSLSVVLVARGIFYSAPHRVSCRPEPTYAQIALQTGPKKSATPSAVGKSPLH